MSLTGVGWRQGAANFLAGLRDADALASAIRNGTMSPAQFSKLAGLPSSAVPTTRAINTTAPLAGGGDLSVDRTLSIDLSSSRVFVINTATIDWLTPGTTVTLVPQASPIGSLSGKRVQLSTRYMQVTALTGTVTGSPTWKAGNNGSHDNLQSTVAVGTGFNTATVNQAAAAGGGTFPVPFVDMTTGDIILETVAAATGTGLTVFQGKMVFVVVVSG